MSAEEGGSELRVLVADHHLHQRRMVADTVRATGRARIEYAGDPTHAVISLETFRPDIIVVDWDLNGCDGLLLVRRLRSGEAGARAKAIPIIMTGQCTAIEVETARTAGVDEFVARPFSTHTMMKRVMEVRLRRRQFIETPTYTGPCRRRRVADESYEGPWRRLFDTDDKRADAPEVQIRKGMVRMYVERINGHMGALTPGDSGAFRELTLMAGQLSTLASDMKDKQLSASTASLFNYVKGVGEGGLRRDVVDAHLGAVLQLAELQNHQVEIRQTVTNELSALVAKLLQQKGAA
jgi:DNA-binding response OmpR family regulator